MNLLKNLLVALAVAFCLNAKSQSYYSFFQNNDSIYNLEWQYNDPGFTVQILYYPMKFYDNRAVHFMLKSVYLDSVPNQSGAPNNYLWRASNGEIRMRSGSVLLSTDTVSLSARLNSKFAFPSGNTSQYIRGDGSLSSFPAIPTNTNQLTNGSGFIDNTYYSAGTGISISGGVISRSKKQETFSGTTNSSGNYTVTFGAAYSVAPNIQANIIGGTNTNLIKITSVSTTGFTVNVVNRTDVVGLLPSYANVNGAAVDVLITEK